MHHWIFTGGPESVSIPKSRTFIQNQAEKRTLNLKCEFAPADSNPASELVFTWTGCPSNNGNSCNFRPQPGVDDDKVISCTVTNPRNNNKQKTGSYTLDLKCEY